MLCYSSVFYSLDTVREEMRLVCLHNDHIEEVSPVFSNHVCHSFVTAEGRFKKKEKKRLQHSFFMSQS